MEKIFSLVKEINPNKKQTCKKNKHHDKLYIEKRHILRRTKIEKVY